MKTRSFQQQVIAFAIMAALSIETITAQDVTPELIGMAIFGGSANNGTIFKIKKDGSTVKVLLNFNNENGRLPNGSLIKASNGSLYGLTAGGGLYGMGTIFKIKADGTSHKIIHHFTNNDGRWPSGSLVQGKDGALYGMTYSGGFLNFGTAYKINIDGSGFTVLHYFNGADGGLSFEGSLIQASDGMFYGIGYNYYQTGYLGTIFKFNSDGSAFKVIHEFANRPRGTLVEGLDGSLCGITGEAIFKIKTDGSGFRILHNLNASEGSGLQTALVQGPDGSLYGLAHDDGSFDLGTIFKLSPDGSKLTVLHHFNGASGAHPVGVLMLYDNNRLTGFTSQGGLTNEGVIFKYNLETSSYYKMADKNQVTGTNNLSSYGGLLLVHPPGSIETPTEPAHTIIFNNTFAKSMDISFTPGDGSKRLAIMRAGSPPDFKPVDNTVYKNDLGNGQSVVFNGTGTSFNVSPLDPDTEYYITIFEYNDNGTTIRYLVDRAPLASKHTKPTIEKFYGMTTRGGVSAGGTIYRFDANDFSNISVVHSFKSLTGAWPFGSLTEAKDGTLFGMTNSGSYDALSGTIFKISADGTSYTPLHNFSKSDGTYPRGSLIQATNNGLYGMAPGGGTSGNGAIFKMNTDGSGFKAIHDFTYQDGTVGTGSLIQASNGALYGMTGSGGSAGIGTIFKVALDGRGFKVLYNFTTPNERYNFGSLIQAADGFLYGMTNGGSSEYPGSIFKIRMDGSSYTVLYNFPSYREGSPEGSLTQAPDGSLYGMTVGDATNTSPAGYGTIFKINPNGSGYKVVHYFNGLDGSLPKGSLTLHNNKLFGFTTKGGQNDGGVIFNVDLATGTFNKMSDLSNSTGLNPWSGNLLLVDAPKEEMNYVINPAHNSLYLPLSLKVTANLISDAKIYTIELNTDPAFGESTAMRSTGGRTQSFSNLALGTIYYNRVKTDVTPNWGDTRQFITGDRLTLAFVISPFNNATNISWAPAVEVNTVPDAQTYTVQLTKSQWFDSPEIFEMTGNSTRFNFSGLEPNTKYYSRVKTDLFPDNWGPGRSFTTGDPVSLSYIISPSNNAKGINTTTNIISNTVPSASNYTIQISEKSDFSSIAFQSSSSSPSISFSGLKYNTTYYNRVRTNLTSSYGVVRSFTTRFENSKAVAARIAGSPEDYAASEMKEPHITVYPNPFREKLFFYIENPSADEANVMLTDLGGNTLYQSLAKTNSMNEYSAPLPNGVYFLRIKVGLFRKVVKVVKVQ